MPTTKAKDATKKGRKGKKKSRNESEGRKKTTKKAAKATKSSNNGKSSGKASRGATSPKDKRQLVQERKILRSQSRWLQKALFALGKAEDDHEKLAEVRGDQHEPMAVTIDGTTHQVGDVTDSLRDSVMERLERLRVTLRNEHALMG